MPRFSLFGLLAGVVVIALFSTALASSSDGWLRAVRMLALLLVMSIAVCAIYLRGPSRAFAGGFTLFAVTLGCLFFFHEGGMTRWGVWPLLESSSEFIFGPQPPKPQSELVELNAKQVFLKEPSEEAVTTWAALRNEWHLRRRRFATIGHLALVILLAMAGGAIARYAQYRGQKYETRPPDERPPVNDNNDR